MRLNIQLPTPLDIGFVIISPEPNIGRLTSTVRSINRNYSETTPRICVVPKNTSTADIHEIKTICPTTRGRDTITSLISTGIRKGHQNWNVVIMEGVWVRPNLNSKYANFQEDDKDIFYAIVPDYDREGSLVRLNNQFIDASINGICIHQKTFKEVGDFDDQAEFEIAKLLWAARATDAGCRFKAVLGAKIC